MDFGLALRDEADATMTADGQILGTPAYMSPEQAAGLSHRVDGRSDVYSLGVVLYQLLTGALPFRGNSRMLLDQVLREEPPPLRKLDAKVPRDLETITLKCLAKAADRRYATAGELAADLRRWLAGEPIKARPQGAWERGLRWARRRPATAALLAVTVAGLLALVGGSLWYNARLSDALNTAESRRHEAETEREEARRERQQAVTNLYHSLTREARAVRLFRENGYRKHVWALLKQAQDLETPARSLDKLRLEAAACLGDFVGLEPTVQDFPDDIRVLLKPYSRFALHPDGERLAVGLSDGTVLLHHVGTGANTRLTGHWAAVNTVAFGPAGTTLVSGDAQGTIKVWEQKGSAAWTCTRTLPASLGSVGALAVSPNGMQLAVAPWAGRAVSLWNLVDGTRAGTCRFPQGLAGTSPWLHHTLAFSPRGGLLLGAYQHERTPFSGSNVHGFVVWQTATGMVEHNWVSQLEDMNDFCFGPGGQTLVCGCASGIAVFDGATFELRHLVRGDNLDRVALSPDGQWMASPNSQIGMVRLYSTAMNREVATLRHPGSPLFAGFSARGTRLVSADVRSVRIWNLQGTGEKQVLPGHVNGVPGLAFSPDGKLLVSCSADRTVRIRDLAHGETVRTLELAGPVQAIAFSPDGSLLATGDWAGNLRIWQVGSWHDQPVLLHGLGNNPWCVAFSRDGKYFGAAGLSGVAIWRIRPNPTATAKGPALGLQLIARPTGRYTRTLAFSPQNDQVAWADGTEDPKGVHLWDLGAGRPHAFPPIRLVGDILSLAFSPDGRHLIGINPERTGEMWNLETGEKEFSFGGGELVEKDSGLALGSVIALSPDGTRFASQSGRSATVWDLRTRRLLLALPEERGITWSLAWSPRGDQLAVGSSDGEVILWKLPQVRRQLAEIGLGW
jgi:WD40 repeat protein